METQRASELVRAERERIESALGEVQRTHALGEEAEEHADPVAPEDESDLYGKELDVGFAEDLQEQLRAVERAEQRLKDGTYGQSVESGDPIPDARLEAIPTAERTIEEQARYERGS